MEWVELIAAIAEFALDPAGALKRWMVPLGVLMLGIAVCLALAHLHR